MGRKILLLVLSVLLCLALASCGDKLGKALEEAEIGELVAVGTYEQDNNEENGKEALEWRVLAKDEEKVLLVTDKVIDCIQFNDTISLGLIWEDSSIRKWLDEQFIETAFTEDEVARILETSNENDSVPDYGIPAKEKTTDRVFLLSIRETTEYMGSEEYSSIADENCVAFPTEYAVAKDIEVRNGGAVMWWLRESTAEQKAAACDDLGKRFHRGRDMNYTRTGVRPAMWVKIENK